MYVRFGGEGCETACSNTCQARGLYPTYRTGGARAAFPGRSREGSGLDVQRHLSATHPQSFDWWSGAQPLAQFRAAVCSGRALGSPGGRALVASAVGALIVEGWGWLHKREKSSA